MVGRRRSLGRRTAVLLPGRLVVVWLCARINRVPAGLHWTEAARLHFAGKVMLFAQVAACLLLATLLPWRAATGELTASAAIPRALLAGCTFWLLSRVILFRHTRRHQPWLTWRRFADGQVVGVLLYAAPLVCAIGLALGGPADCSRDPIGCVVFYGIGPPGLLWYMTRGVVLVVRLLGLLRDGDERLRRLVAEIEQQCGHRVRRAFLLRVPVANAAALPHRNEIVVTRRALEQLTDEQMKAILLHEVGHLRQGPRAVWMRALVVVPLVVVVWARPLLALVGALGLVAALVGSIALLVMVLRRSKQREVEADSHAHAHEGEAGTYARALERLHECGLVPAVMRGKVLTHPHLYDRMLAAGVVPDYPRPLPPPRRPRQMFACTGLMVLAMSGMLWALHSVTQRMYESPTAAGLRAVLDGGSLGSLAAMGYQWVVDRPNDAAVVLRYVASRSERPEYSAWLVHALAESDPSGAKASLQRAEQLLAQQPDAVEWQVETVAAARERLGLPK